MENKQKVTINLNWTGLLQVALIILKLTGLINISWWWVWSPSIAGITIVLLAVIFVFVVSLIKEMGE